MTAEVWKAKMELAEGRYDYSHGSLSEEEAGDDPLALFERWLQAAKDAKIIEPTAFCLATANTNGAPSARYVLLRQFDARGFVFFSHYDGRKGNELRVNPSAAMTFWWSGLERQIRIEGSTERLDPEESDLYWAGRPLASRIASAASPQTEIIPDREALEARVEEVRRRYPNGPPRPDSWGGTRLVPTCIEFWQGRPSRLHDRLLFTREAESWQRKRLAP